MNLRESRRCFRSCLKRVDGDLLPTDWKKGKKAETNNYPGTPPQSRIGAWNNKVRSTGSAKS